MQKAAAASKLFHPLKLGSIGTLSHRVVLAPLTRNRAAEPSLAPTSALAVQYYRQRATRGGLLITEATHVSPESLAYPSTPGIWSEEQAEGWKAVTTAVHEKGGRIVCQLWHTGRVAHPDYSSHPCNNNDDDDNSKMKYRTCVSASAVPIANRKGVPAKTATYHGIKPHGTPRPLDAEVDIPRLCQDYKHAARMAMDAGFDGVELHAAHGYLIDQFLNDGVNLRTDEYGGSAENRCRLLNEVLDAIFEVWPSDGVGVRLSPHDAPGGGNTYYGARDSNPDLVYRHAVRTLDRRGLAYLLLTEPRWVGKYDDNPETDPGFRMPLRNLITFRKDYGGVMIGAGGFTPATSYTAMNDDNDTALPANNGNSSSGYDALAFGRWFISNPDLPARLKSFHEYKAKGGGGGGGGGGGSSLSPPPPLNRYERDTFYSQEAEGYIDYPSLEFEEFCKLGSPAGSEKPEYRGMELGKYTLLEQDGVGSSLKATESRPRSKL